MYKRQVYVVSTDDGFGISKGDILQENVNVKKQQIYSGLEDYNYITEEDMGSTAIIDMYEGMTVMTNMITPLAVSYTHLDVYKRQMMCRLTGHIH